MKRIGVWVVVLFFVFKGLFVSSVADAGVGVEDGDVVGLLRVLCFSRRVTDVRGNSCLVPGLVEQVGCVRGEVGGVGSSGFGSRPPVWLSLVDWERRLGLWLDGVVGVQCGWGLRWRVLWLLWQVRCGRVVVDDGDVSVLSGLVREGLRLVYPVLFEVVADCPVCGVGEVVGDGGVRGAALVVRELGAECLGCGSQWPGVEVLGLSALVGGSSAA